MGQENKEAGQGLRGLVEGTGLMKPLRIFCAIEKEPFRGSQLWYNNIVAALRDLGHQVIEFDFDIDPFYHHADLRQSQNRDWVAQRRPELENQLLAQVTKIHATEPLDILFTYFYDAHCTPATIKKLNALGITSYNWYCNASYQLHLVANLAPAYDFCLVPEAFRLTDYRSLGANPVYCQEAANPNFYRKSDIRKDLGAVFIGQNYADRYAHGLAIDDAALPLAIWGHNWNIRADSSWRALVKKALGRKGNRVMRYAELHPPCTDAAMVEIYNRAKIALGFGVVASEHFNEKPIFQIRLRDFEAPMCGTFYLTQHQEELDSFFKVGHEIETFRSPAELVDKVKFYLEHEDARERIALAGYERARRDHTWQRRLTKVFAATLEDHGRRR